MIDVKNFRLISIANLEKVVAICLINEYFRERNLYFLMGMGSGPPTLQKLL